MITNLLLSDGLLENQHVDNGLRLPKKIKLMTRKVRAVVRFHTPSKTTEPENKKTVMTNSINNNEEQKSPDEDHIPTDDILMPGRN